MSILLCATFVSCVNNKIWIRIEEKNILYIYRVLMFSHLPLPKVLILLLFSFSVDPFQVVNSPLSHSSCNLLHTKFALYLGPKANKPFTIFHGRRCVEICCTALMFLIIVLDLLLDFSLASVCSSSGVISLDEQCTKAITNIKAVQQSSTQRWP